MKRGSVYWVNLEPASPPEFGKVRPGLIISNTEQNIHLPTVVILPLSSQKPEVWPLRIECSLPKGPVSFVVIPGIRQVHKARLMEMIGTVSPSVLEKIDGALMAYLGE